MSGSLIQRFRQWKLSRQRRYLDEHEHEWIKDPSSLAYLCTFPNCSSTLPAINPGTVDDYWIEEDCEHVPRFDRVSFRDRCVKCGHKFTDQELREYYDRNDVDP